MRDKNGEKPELVCGVLKSCVHFTFNLSIGNLCELPSEEVLEPEVVCSAEGVGSTAADEVRQYAITRSVFTHCLNLLARFDEGFATIGE